MSGRSRYSFEFGTGRIPCVVITEPPALQVGPSMVPVRGPRTVVKRRYGFTKQHAMNRAIDWSRKNGDPR